MGVDIAILLDHQVGLDRIHELPEMLFEAFRGGDLGWPPGYLRRWRGGFERAVGSPWYFLPDPDIGGPAETLAAQGYVMVEHGSGWGGSFGHTLLELTHLTRYGVFCRDAAVRDAITGAIARLGPLAGATRAIYLPDTSFTISKVLEAVAFKLSIAEVLAELHELDGPPKPSPAALYSDEHPGTGMYAVDKFE